jgi:hypothetical protein
MALRVGRDVWNVRLVLDCSDGFHVDEVCGDLNP